MLTGENLAGNVCFGRDTPVAFPQFACAVFLPLAHAYGCAFDMLTLLPWGHMSLCYVRLLLAHTSESIVGSEAKSCDMCASDS